MKINFITFFYILMFAMLIQGCSLKTPRLIEMAGDNNIEKVKYLLEVEDNDANDKDIAGQTALMYSDNYEMSKLLIDNGADVTIQADYNGETALSMSNDYEVSKLLINNGADVNSKNNYGRTPLMGSMYRDAPIAIAKLLVESGADMNLRDDNGNTALFYAYKIGRYNGTQEKIDFLLKNGIDPNIKNDDGLKAAEIIVNINDDGKTITSPYINKTTKVRKGYGILNFKYTNQHINESRKYPNDKMRTRVYIQNIDTKIFYVIFTDQNQISIPTGKYNVVWFRGDISNSKEKLNNVFKIHKDNLYFDHLPTNDLLRIQFEIDDHYTTCIDIQSTTRKLSNEGLVLDTSFIGFANFKVKTGCENFSNLLTAAIDNKNDVLIEWGFDQSVNLDYLKVGKLNPNVYYLGSVPSFDLNYYIQKNFDGKREILGLRKDAEEELVEELNEVHLIEKNEFIKKYLNK